MSRDIEDIERNPLAPGDRIKLAGEVQRDGQVLPMGTMGTVVSVDVNANRAEVDWDAVNPVTAEPVQVALVLDVDPFWVEVDCCSGYLDVGDAIADGWVIDITDNTGEM